ncbi:hypothetical protein QBC38DRAFT_187895 [Podospora fimiseda]|uniref:DNA/RNA-binding protein Alba-like domain-containing protein n=1 Tax=Podospora fimiseda TaxID=252190 RepID=A0AAN7BQH7_9PEZI|nr:hypothetical protein QBC38DRAFT_187895 [Podospora fimiseda]
MPTTTARRKDPSSPSTSIPAAGAAGKRKFPSDNCNQTTSASSSKKRRTTAAAVSATSNPEAHASSVPPTTSPYAKVYNPILEKLNNKYEVKALSVIPSTSIRKHVDKALQHLGRFSAWDQKVLPGTVLFCAKSSTSNKLITIVELIRRRIGETEQKWYQYNVLSETICEEPIAQRKRPDVVDETVVEDTFMDVDGEEENDDDDEYFETMRPAKTIYELAVDPPKIRYQAHITVLLSRVPLEELRNIQSVSLQTNEHYVEHLRKKRAGLAN